LRQTYYFNNKEAAMPSEAGDMKLLGNFRKLVDQVSADSTYNPSNASLAKSALEAQHAAAFAAVEAVSTKLAPNKIAISEREKAFAALAKLVTSSRNVLKATGVSSEVLADAETFVRKLTGTRKAPKVAEVKAATENPDTPETKLGRTTQPRS
jgi:hypothetical protein